VSPEDVARIAAAHGMTAEQVRASISDSAAADVRRAWPTSKHRLRFLLGTDLLGRSLLYRCLTGGGISLGIGIAAAMLAVLIGTLYGAVAGYVGGFTDGLMMRVVDILYGLPYVLLVVLLAVASDAALDEYVTRDHARSRWVHREAAALARQRGENSGYAAIERMLSRDTALKVDLRSKADAAIPARRMSGTRRQAYGRHHAPDGHRRRELAHDGPRGPRAGAFPQESALHRGRAGNGCRAGLDSSAATCSRI
jgi:hypothetical protein